MRADASEFRALDQAYVLLLRAPSWTGPTHRVQNFACDSSKSSTTPWPWGRGALLRRFWPARNWAWQTPVRRY